MHEEPAADIVEAMTDVGRQNHEVIVVDPDAVVPGLQHLTHLVGEELISGQVGVPQVPLEATGGMLLEGENVVHHGP